MRRGIKRVLGIGLVATMGVTLLSGCGSSGDSKTTGAQNSETTIAGAQSVDDSKNTETQTSKGDAVLTVGFWGSSGEDKAVEASLEGVSEAVEGVKEVKLEQYSTVNDFYEKLPGQIAAGTAPDIIIATNEQHLQLIADGVLAPLDDYNYDLSAYAQNAVEAWQYEGKQYGIPITAAPSAFIINTDMWDAAGLGDFPKTWEDVYDAAKVLTTDDVAGLCIEAGTIFHPTQYMNSFGGGWKDGKAINSDENVAGLSFIFKMFDEGLAISAKEAGLTWDGEVFAGGKCAMTTGGTWYVNLMREAAPDVNYTFVPVPGGNGEEGCTLHSYGIAVVNKTPDIKIAADVAYYMSRQEAQENRAELIGDRPAIKEALPVFRELNPQLVVMDDYIDKATSFGYPANQEFKTDFTTVLENHIYNNDTTSAKDALDKLAESYGVK